MGTSSVTVERVVCYLPPWLKSAIDQEIGYDGISRSDVIRKWLQRVFEWNKKKAS